MMIRTTFLALMASSTVSLATSQDVPSTVSGILDVLVADDLAHASSRLVYVVHDSATGQSYELLGGTRLLEPLASGTWVAVHGLKERDVLRVSVQDVHVLAKPAVSAEALTSGVKTSAVFLLNLPDAPNACTPAQIANQMYVGSSSIDAYYRETSYGFVSFPADTDGNGQPDVFGPFSVSGSRTGPCDFWGWADAADQAATVAGVDMSRYKFRIYAIPPDTTCSWSGFALTGCDSIAAGPCRAWIKGGCSGGSSIYAHELGHNLGLLHASLDPNNDGIIDSDMGDTSDPLGWGILVHMNAPHKVQMGWLAEPKIADVRQSGTYTLAPIEVAPGSTALPQTLRISDFYYLSYRRPVGFDTNLPQGHWDHTSVHRSSNWYPTCTYNGEARAYPCQSQTMFVSALADGQTFEDPANGLAVTQVSHDANSSTLQINLDSPARSFHTLRPCRLLDTRESTVLASGVEVVFDLNALCGIPATAKAISVNVTVTGPTSAGHLILYAGNIHAPGTSTINFQAGKTRANSAVLPLSAEGYHSIRAMPFVSGNGVVHLIVDVNGYFE